MKAVIVTGGFDDMRPCDVRFLQEAAKLGPVHALVWSDALLCARSERPPKFPQAERLYVVESLRYVTHASAVDSDEGGHEGLPLNVLHADAVWVTDAAGDTPGRRAFCAAHDLAYRVMPETDLSGFPLPALAAGDEPGRRRVVVTGCFDWFHSGHVRFFEEISALGELFVVVGHDENLRLLKGAGHPLFPEQERLYMVAAVRYVAGAMLSTGQGWLDAEPELLKIRPAAYAVNEDGDKPEKREMCARLGIEYIVLQRRPRPGLPRRESTMLRGF